MTRIFTEGFEMQDSVFWSDPGQSSITLTGARSGVACCSRIYSNTNLPYKNIPDLSEFYVRFGFTVTNPAGYKIIIFSHSPTGKLCSINISSTDVKIILYNDLGTPTEVASGNTTIDNDTWYLMEVYVKIADSGGVVTVKIDDTQIATFSGDTLTAGYTHVDYLSFLDYITGAIDDLALNDTNGSVDNSWCGDGKIIMLSPNGNGDLSQLAGSDGDSTNNYLLVDEFPKDDDTTYVEGSTVDQKDLYNLTPCSLTGSAVIRRVYAEARVKWTVSDTEQVALTIKTHSTEYDGPDISPVNAYNVKVLGTDYPLNPNTSAAWTVTELDALQVGPKTRN